MAGETGTATAQGAPAEPATGASGTAQGATTDPAPGATTAAQGATADGQGPDGATGGQVSAADLQAKVAALEADNRKYRQQAAKAEAERKAKADAELSEVERLTARNAELERTIADRTTREREQSLRLATVTAAGKLGFRDPDIAYRLIAAESFEWNEDGTPKGVEQRLAALAKDSPYLVAGQDFGGGVRGTSPAASGGSDMNAIIRAAAGSKG